MQFAHNIAPVTSPIEWLETERKIPIDIASRFGVTTLRGNLAFEFWKRGELQYRKMRIVESDGSKRFQRDVKDVPSCMFNEECLADECSDDDILIITEGEIDCLSFLTIGCPFVVSVPDGSPFQKPGENDIKPIEDRACAYLWDGNKLRADIAKFKRVLLATDNDEKGRILRDELAIRIGRNKCWHITFPDSCKDANEVLVKYGPDVLIETLTTIEPMVASRLVPFSAIPESGYKTTYRSGWDCLNDHLRIVPPELIVVTGTPGAGKSQFTLALVANLARDYQIRGAIMQFEDNVERNRTDLIRYALNMGRRRGDQIVAAGNPKQDAEARAWMDRYFLTISPSEEIEASADYTLAWLQEAIEEAATRHGCKWVLIDPWNELEHIWARHESESKYTNDALRMMKRLARRYQMIIIIVTHPSKEGGKVRNIDEMSIYDVAGSAAFKNKCDHGIIIARDEDHNCTWVKIDKSKNHFVMGAPGKVKMVFKPGFGTFDKFEMAPVKP